MTPAEQRDIPWTLLPSSDPRWLKDMLPLIERAILRDTIARVGMCLVGCAVTVRLHLTGGDTMGATGLHPPMRATMEHDIEVEMHPSLIEGDGPHHPWDATDAAVTDAFMKVVRTVVDAPRITIARFPFPEDGPRHGDDSFDVRTSLAAVRLRESGMPDDDVSTIRTALTVATPLGTGGLSVYETNGPSWVTDVSPRYVAHGAVDMTTGTITMADGRQTLETRVRASTMRTCVLRPTAIERLRMENEAAILEASATGRPEGRRRR
jgi:hypothetical protein